MGVLKKYKNILIGLIVVVLIFVVYSYFFAGGEEEATLSSQTPSGLDVNEPGNELLGLLSNLRSIELNENLFANELFLSLEDFGVPLIEQAVGRQNPFAPIGASEVTAVPFEDELLEEEDESTDDPIASEVDTQDASVR